MAIFEMTPEILAQKLTESVASEVEKKIKELLMAQASSIVEQMAKDLASSIKGAVHSYRNNMSGTVEVALVLNSVEHKIKGG